MYIYIYIYIYIYLHKLTSRCHGQTTPSSDPRSGDSQDQETFLAPYPDKQPRNFDTECSNHHPSLSTLRSKGWDWAVAR